MAITYKFEEVLKHKQTGDCWLVIDGKVYDLSPFMEDHPGGDEVLLAATGKDATNDFEDVGHSDSAREMMHQYCIGDVDPSTVPRRKILVADHVQHSSGSASEFFIKLLQFLVPILILALAFAVRRYTKEN